MSHQDMKSDAINHEQLKQSIDCLMPSPIFRSLKSRAGATWKMRTLATAAFIWGCLSDGPLEERFLRARDVAAKIFRWFDPPGKTYEGFKKVLCRKHGRIKPLLITSWREQTRNLAQPETVAGFFLLGVDGSRIELPRTVANEEHYAPSRSTKPKKRRPPRKRRPAAKRKKKRRYTSTPKKLTSPLMWLTMVWHAASGLPWSWRTGPSDSSERRHLQEMLPEMPQNTLITADCGFAGYEQWKAIIDHGLQFLIRVGGNMRLIRHLGYARQYAHTVYGSNFARRRIEIRRGRIAKHNAFHGKRLPLAAGRSCKIRANRHLRHENLDAGNVH